jgi:hypothetical protein
MSDRPSALTVTPIFLPSRAPELNPVENVWQLLLDRAGWHTTSKLDRQHEFADGGIIMTDTPQILLGHHLKALKLPTFLREYEKLARQCAAEGLDHVRFLLRLDELG